MTTWQWRVIIALCRLVRFIIQQPSYNARIMSLPREQRDELFEDDAFLGEALEREQRK